MNCISDLSGERRILRFDGKQFYNLFGSDKIEMIAICFGTTLIGLKAVENKHAIRETLFEHNIKSIFVVCDTEPANTGRKNGVVTQLQKDFPHLQYEPCRGDYQASKVR